jgi:hypothetical protein
MTQQWLTVLGLGLDFLGFMLLLREWWQGNRVNATPP